jgi:hypothetical protein
MNENYNIIPPHGGYQNLKSYQATEIIYDATVKFCERFINPRSRTVDQMVQAARSGKQNIAEGFPGLRHFEENRTQTYWGSQGEPGRATHRLQGFSAG